jgi:glycosyltransferase involved in cell wall biosynthesis
VAQGDRRSARIWIFHHHLFHYRLPFWDQLAERGCGRYEITCFGEMAGDEAIGGGRRPYLRPMPVIGGIGTVGYTFKGAKQLVEREQPEIVMIIPNPRNRLSYQIPALCAQYGGITVAWSKVHSKSLLPDPMLRMLKRRVYLPYDFAYTYGPESTRELVALGFDPARIFTAHNTIDTSRIFTHGDQLRAEGAALRRERGLGGKIILLCIAKMHPQKRHQDLLDAWPRLRQLHPDLVLVLAGSGPLAERIRIKAEQSDPERIIFLGRVPEGDDYRWLATADMNIQCGAVGLAVNQSMALGTPTIVADEPGSDAEIVTAGKTGWRYKKADINALVAAVQSVLTDWPARERITAEAVQFIREEASIERMAAVADACISTALSAVGRASRC